jgi:hypothetical protein
MLRLYDAAKRIGEQCRVLIYLTIFSEDVPTNQGVGSSNLSGRTRTNENGSNRKIRAVFISALPHFRFLIRAVDPMRDQNFS